MNIKFQLTDTEQPKENYPKIPDQSERTPQRWQVPTRPGRGPCLVGEPVDLAYLGTQ